VAQVSIELPHLLWTPSLPKVILRILFPLVNPVQGKPIEECGTLVITANANELTLPILIRLLEDGEDGSPGNPVKTYPQAVPEVFGLKQK